jgi:hypothetical protein
MTSQAEAQGSGRVELEEESFFLRAGTAQWRLYHVARTRCPLKAKPVLSTMYLGPSADLHSRLWTGSLLGYLVPAMFPLCWRCICLDFCDPVTNECFPSIGITTYPT